MDTTDTRDPGPAGQALRPLLDPTRLRALADLGLTGTSDAGMERHATRVRDLLGVPVSLVSLVQADQQVFPGMCGLPDPWATLRSTPLSHSFCQHVVTTGEPLIIEDARLDPRVEGNLAIDELNVVAYAGMPLSDDDGNVLGSLCAIQSTPRAWTVEDITLLRDLAVDCSNELRLRLSRLDAERERSRRDAIDVELQQTLVRAQSLLAIAEALNTCRTTDDIRHHLSGFADPEVGLTAIDLELHRDLDPDRIALFDRLMADRTVVVVGDLTEPHDVLDLATRTRYLDAGIRAVGFLRLRSSARSLGHVELLWDVSRDLDQQERAMAAALSAYTSQALERAILIEDRISVAHQLQSAMLAPLPTDTGLDVAACYLPANAEERVGGDWYDLFAGPQDPETGVPTGVVASVGDITGHDLVAATIMGQLRAMLRQAAWDSPAAPPSAHLAALEAACHSFGIPATGTAVLARLAHRPGSASWDLTWVNAGHPPPLVAAPDGSTRLLSDHDLLFGYPELSVHPRRDHAVELEPGSTLVVYTDGLVDGSALDPVAQTDQLATLVSDHHAEGAAAVVRAIESTFVDFDDDIVVLVIHVPMDVRQHLAP